MKSWHRFFIQRLLRVVQRDRLAELQLAILQVDHEPAAQAVSVATDNLLLEREQLVHGGDGLHIICRDGMAQAGRHSVVGGTVLGWQGHVALPPPSRFIPSHSSECCYTNEIIRSMTD